MSSLFHKSTCTFTVSELQPFMDRKTISCDASLTLSPHSLDLRKLSLHRSTHINNLISVLILVNLDVLGLDLLRGDRSFFFLSGLLDDSGLLHFDCVDEVFCEFLNCAISFWWLYSDRPCLLSRRVTITLVSSLSWSCRVVLVCRITHGLPP